MLNVMIYKTIKYKILFQKIKAYLVLTLVTVFGSFPDAFDKCA